MSILTRLYDFVAGTKIRSAQVDAEFDQLVVGHNDHDTRIGNIQAGTGFTDGSITAPKLASDAVTTVKIVDLNVTTAKLALLSVGTPQLADSSVTSAKIADGAILTVDIADGAITTAKIADGAIVNADINASAAIDGSKLANLSITSAQILDGTIVNADINAAANIDATKIGSGIVNNTEFGYLDGVLSPIQPQINGIVLGTIPDGTLTWAKFDSTTKTDLIGGMIYAYKNLGGSL